MKIFRHQGESNFSGCFFGRSIKNRYAFEICCQWLLKWIDFRYLTLFFPVFPLNLPLIFLQFSGRSKGNIRMKRVKLNSISTKVGKNIQKAVTYLEPCQTSVMKLFLKKLAALIEKKKSASGLYPLLFIQENSIIQKLH